MTAPTNSQIIEADERLATVLGHFYCVQQAATAPAVHQQLLPNYEMLLVFNFGPVIPFALGDSAFGVDQTVVLGPLQTMLRYDLPPGADLIVIVFTLNGFYRLMGQPMRQLRASEWPHADRLLNLAVFDALWKELAALPTRTERIQRISTYVFAHLMPSDGATRSVLDSIPYFSQTVVDPVKAIAQDNRVSARSVQNRFQTQMGYSAKELTRFLRFKNVLSALIRQTPAPVDWLALVTQFGYHDHSHLIKDFRYFLGLTPRQFLKQLAQGEVCMGKSGKFYEPDADAAGMIE